MRTRVAELGGSNEPSRSIRFSRVGALNNMPSPAALLSPDLPCAMEPSLIGGQV